MRDPVRDDSHHNGNNAVSASSTVEQIQEQQPPEVVPPPHEQDSRHITMWTKLVSMVLQLIHLPHLLITTLFCTIGLPPPQVIIRTIRPYGTTFVILTWISYRILSFKKAGGGSTTQGRGDEESVLDWILHYMYKVTNYILTCTTPPSTTTDDGTSTHHVIRSFVQAITMPSFLLLKDLLGLFLLHKLLHLLLLFTSTNGISINEIKSSIVQSIFEFGKEYVPAVQRELAKEERKMEDDMERSLKDTNRIITRTLPKVGRDRKEILMAMRQTSQKENAKWQSGLVSGSVYCGEIDHTNLLNDVYSAYSLSNPLHTDIWPSVNQYEAEVVSMTANLLNGGDSNVVGSTSSGGTESIILATKAHREYYGRRRGIVNGEVVACTTAHAGLDKACDMLNLRLIKLHPDPNTFQLRPSDVERSISSNTIMVYASAPNFPQGVIDPIQDLSDLVLRYGIGLHVDACLGGFVLPFARGLGGGMYEVPRFDFECEGVTSMSVDTHKYGYASKGTSVVLYRNKALRRSQYFSYAQWTGGLYSTPTIAGSRPGALIACAWASLISIGYGGYQSRVKSILDTTQTIATAVEQIPGLYVLGGKPKAMIVCFGSNEYNIYKVGDAMTKRGWSLNSLQRPACIHLCVTLKTVDNVDKFVMALREVVDEVRKKRGGKEEKEEGNAAIYGMAGTMPAGPVEELLKCYTDVTLTP